MLFRSVELKTETDGMNSFRGRFPPKKHSTEKSSSKTRYKNGQLSIVRVTCAARSECKIDRDNRRPWLLIAIGDAQLKSEGNGESRLGSGDTLWFDAGSPIRLRNPGERPAEMLAVEFKKSPASQRSDQ